LLSTHHLVYISIDLYDHGEGQCFARASGSHPHHRYLAYRGCGSGPIFSARSGRKLSQIRRYRDRFPADDGLPGADQRKDEPCIPRYEELPESPASLTLPPKHGLERPLLSWLEPFLRSRDIAYSATRPITIIASPRLPVDFLPFAYIIKLPPPLLSQCCEALVALSMPYI